MNFQLTFEPDIYGRYGETRTHKSPTPKVGGITIILRTEIKMVGGNGIEPFTRGCKPSVIPIN